jgi:predicted O-linked N-acetylglucosamine transferase (SPINDLY family)
MNPAAAQRLLQQAIALQQAGRLAEAAQTLAQARALAPRSVDGWQLSGGVALLSGKPAEAAQFYGQALRLDARSLPCLLGLGVAKLASGDAAGAEAMIRAALRLQPKNADAWGQLAHAQAISGRTAEALESHKKAVECNPKSAPAWQGYGLSLSQQRRAAEALVCFQKALALDPKSAAARHGLAVAMQESHRIPDALREFDTLLAHGPRSLEVMSHRLMTLNYLPEWTRERLFAEHVAYGAAAEAEARAWPSPAFSGQRDPERRLRVVFISADFREHSVAYFFEPILRHLDREAFEPLLYNDRTPPDAMTGRFRELAAGWRDIAGQVHGVVAEKLRADAPDIIVDLSGHTGATRLPLLAARMAPVQVTYLGYPNTTGLRAMDYRFVDAITDPEGDSDAWHTEKLVRFAPTAWVYAPPADAPEPAPAPSVAAGRVVFGSFNNFSKVTDAMLREWAAILGEVPESRLLIKSPGLADPAVAAHVRGRLRAAGCDEARVDLLDVAARTAEHLAMYARIDVALDPFPYNGTTTTCEALWMGVPVVTLCGDRHAARVGASLLQTVGHPEWVATDVAAYRRIAVGLARDEAARVAWRAGARDTLRRSVLFDQAGQAARFGAALRECWRAWCRQG